MGMAIVIRITMMVTTTISLTKVNPGETGSLYHSEYAVPSGAFSWVLV
jgi:hypothetical protein